MTDMTRRAETPPRLTKPSWLTKPLRAGGRFGAVSRSLDRARLRTVCRESRCPNLTECFSRGTATLLILGAVCTRACRFCAVGHGVPGPPDPGEPSAAARTVADLGLRYAVVTSVTRDDLPDGGASHFAATIRAIREISPDTAVEVLVPDFGGDGDALRTVLDAGPDVLAHNMETAPRLYPAVRPGADYGRSLSVLRGVDADIVAKSGLMLGLGETDCEIEEVLCDLRDNGCDLLTIGQYLQASQECLPVERYVPPGEFEQWRIRALGMGFRAVASGPYVRSSYRAGEMGGGDGRVKV